VLCKFLKVLIVFFQLWTLLQEGRCRVKITEEGQVITAPASVLMPEFSEILKPQVPPNSADHTYLNTKDQSTPKPAPAKRKSQPVVKGEKRKSGRPLKQPDPITLVMQEPPNSVTVTTEADLSQQLLMGGGDIVVLTEDQEYLPESVVHTEIVATATDTSVGQSSTKQYSCEICHKALGSARSLQWHMQGFHAPPAYQCAGCGDRFPYQLRRSLCRTCSDPARASKPHRTYRCLSCNRVFKHRFLLMRHRLTCVSDSASVDQRDLDKFIVIEEKLVEEIGEPQEECPQCKEKFHTRKEMKFHLKQAHPGAVQCSGCGSTFENFTLLKHHKKFCKSVIKLDQTVKEPRQFICHICGRSYNSSSKLSDHIKGIHQEPSILCSCGAAFKWRSSLNKHKEKCPFARPEDGKTPRRPARVKVPGEDHVCPHCQIAYKSDSGLRSHIQVKHRQDAAFRCMVCNSFFVTRKQLCKHRENCPPKASSSNAAPTPRKTITYRCAACQTTFKNKTFLQKHIIGMHLPGKRYICSLCGKRFRWNGGLARHRNKCKYNSQQPTEIVTKMSVSNEDFKKSAMVKSNIAAASSAAQSSQVGQTENYIIIETPYVNEADQDMINSGMMIQSDETTESAAQGGEDGEDQIVTMSEAADTATSLSEITQGSEQAPEFAISALSGDVETVDMKSDVDSLEVIECEMELPAENKDDEPVMVFECSLEDALASRLQDSEMTTTLNDDQVQHLIVTEVIKK
jgi:hypothetical protein